MSANVTSINKQCMGWDFDSFDGTPGVRQTITERTDFRDLRELTVQLLWDRRERSLVIRSSLRHHHLRGSRD